MTSKQFQAFVIRLLRRGTYKWKPRSDAEKAAKVQVGTFSTGRPKYKYQCRKCHGLFLKKDTCIDHIKPVIPPKGFTTFDDYVANLFCKEDNFQVLCVDCHKEKTKKEVQERKEYRKNNKEKKL